MLNETNIKICDILEVLTVSQVKSHCRETRVLQMLKINGAKYKAFIFYEIFRLNKEFRRFHIFLQNLKWYRDSDSSSGHTIRTFKVSQILAFVSFNVSTHVEAFSH